MTSPAPPTLGIGIDIIEVGRIRNSLERFGERFTRRILRPEEWTYCQLHRDPAPFAAARFAAKEAVSKAFGTGIGEHLGWLDLEVVRKPSGEPTLVLHGKGQTLLAARGAKQVLISLSHTEQYAAAVALLQ